MKINDIKAIIAKDENHVLELKKTTGELIKGNSKIEPAISQPIEIV